MEISPSSYQAYIPMIERSTAPSKTDVQMVVYRASKQIEKDPDPDIRQVRAKHLADAKAEKKRKTH